MRKSRLTGTALLLAFAALLALAPAAGARRGVVGYAALETPPFDGLDAFNYRITSPSIPDSAAGGDIYTTGSKSIGGGSSSGAFGARYSPSGQLKRVWGADIVASGPGNADETQAVWVKASAGAFTLGYGADTTGPLNFGADASAVQSALNALSSISTGGGSVTVSGGPGDAGGTSPYLVSFDGGPLHGTDVPLLQADGAGLTGSVTAYTTNPGATGFEICDIARDTCKTPIDQSTTLPLSVVKGADRPGGGLTGGLVNPQNGDFYATTSLRRVSRYSPSGEPLSSFGFDVVRQGPDDSSVDAAQQLTVTAASGSYTLSIGSQASTPIAVGATAATVKAAIDALPELQSTGGSVSVSGPNGGPYTITFDGGGAGGDQWGQLKPSPSSAANVTTVQKGGAVEVCKPDDACKFGGSGGGADGTVALSANALALAPAGTPNQGDVLIGSSNSVTEFTPDGQFARSFGWDVVRSGPDQVAAPDEQQQVTVKASGGAFTLNLRSSAGTNVNTAAIPFNATPAQMKSAIDNALVTLASFDENTPGTVTVSGGPGDLGGNNPYTIDFGGSLAGDNVPQMGSSATGLSGPRTVTLQNATGGTFTLKFPNSNSGKTTAPIPFNASAATVQSDLAALSTIGAGNVSVSGPNGGPWQITFTGALAGITNFAADSPEADGSALSGPSPTVTVARPSASPSTLTEGGAFEVCKAGSDVCKGGSSGSGLGQFDAATNGPPSVAEGPDGTIYAVDDGNLRVLRFTPGSGLDLTPALFGVNEVQQLSVNAATGGFKLSAIEPQGTSGRATLTQGSPVLTNVSTDTGAFQVGQRLYSSVSNGDAIPLGVTIAAVGAGTITLSRPVGQIIACANPCVSSTITADNLHTTPDLPYNASAAAVQGAIDDLLSKTGNGGASVSVSGPDGGPWTIAYDGGTAPRTDFAPLGTAQGSPPLSGGSGPGADQATVTTIGDGGPSGRVQSAGGALIKYRDDYPISVSMLPNGDVAIAKKFTIDAVSCPQDWPFDLAPYSASAQFTRTQEFAPDGGTLVDTSPPCDVNPGVFFDGKASGLPNRASFTGEVGTAPSMSLNPLGAPTSSGVTISGEIDPNGVGPIDLPNPSLTRYAVDFRKVGDANWTRYVSRVPVGSGPDPVPFSVGLSGLQPKATYEARIVALKPNGFTPLVQTTAQFTTLAGKPVVASPYSDKVSASAADLHGLVTANGAETKYHFEYGPTIAYGQSTPEVSVGDGTDPVAAFAHIDALDPVVQHFRLVATNSEGTVYGPDQTFNFYPEPCPNAAARQQTGSDLLPDCRAYEMVSPDRMGSVQLFSHGPSTSLASSPPRFSFAVQGGTLPGPWSPLNAPFGSEDYYVATRTDAGWQTHYVGFSSDTTYMPYNNAGNSLALEGDAGFDRFLAWGLDPSQSGQWSAPALFDAQGNQLGRLPSNLDQVPGSDLDIASGGFYGEEKLSGDGRHFIFSSANLAFAPGGLSSGAGSAYDDDLATGEVMLISKTEAGADIPQVPGGTNTGHPLSIPAVSQNGSHVLIGAPSQCPGGLILHFVCSNSPLVLYMSVNDTTHYDVSQGHAVDFQGMSRDGSAVFFSSDEQLTPDDHDSSTDLFRWSEQSNAITRVSTGTAPVGDSDACAATWTSGCGAQALPHNNSPSRGTWPDTDNAVSANGNAVYFYSPEQLVGTDGFPGRRNLYAYRDGNVSFVASLDADKPASRIQVSADGRYAAFITKTRLTSYDNAGHAEMYRWDDGAQSLVCVSCIPDGTPPSHDVLGSQNGTFLSDDGRAFFTTSDPLIPRDADGLADVYEYSEGRAQLISTGVAAQGDPNTGLVGVSADGADAYFLTLETLVPQDHNGPFLKFYDARVNGGFPAPAQIAPCQAADECHGPGSAAPVAPVTGSGSDLGAGGNAPAPPKPCRKGRVRKHGRCVARHPHKKHRAKRHRQGHKRRAHR